MNLELKHLAPYLPYGLKCQYEGIINGKEISKNLKEFKKESEFPNWDNYKPINEEIGLKIAPLKTITVFKNFWIAKCGIFSGGQKTFYNGIGIKPLLLPINKLIDSEFKKEFEEKFDYIGFDFEHYSSLIDCVSDSNILSFPYELVLWLIEKHFDIYSLIEQGLAIDVNTIK